MQILQPCVGCEGYWSDIVNHWLCNVNVKGLIQKWFWSVSRYFVIFKIMVFWHAMVYRMVNRHQYSVGTDFLHVQDRRLEEESTASIHLNIRDGSSGFLWSVGTYLPDYILSHHGRFMLLFTATRTSNFVYYLLLFLEVPWKTVKNVRIVKSNLSYTLG
jgi:hypothetical protein